MRRLIDCTYLHAVARCLRSEAQHLDDLITYLRFVAEVLISDRILYTADPTGPVFEKAKEAESELISAAKMQGLLQHFEVSAIDYKSVVNSAAQQLAEDLHVLARNPSATSSLSPAFAGGIDDPDGEILELIDVHVLKRKDPGSLPVLCPANVARYLLLTPDVLRELRAGAVFGNELTTTNVLAFAACARMLVYRVMGGHLGAAYLPATSRSRLLPSLSGMGYDGSVDDLLAATVDGKPGASSLALIVDAIIRSCNGNPTEILRTAYLLRGQMEEIKGLVSLRIPMDACMITVQDARKLRRIEEALAVELSGDKAPHWADSFQLNFIVGLLPTFSIRLEQFRAWLAHARASHQLCGIGEFVLRSRSRQANECYDNFKLYTGLHETHATNPSSRGAAGSGKDSSE